MNNFIYENKTKVYFSNDMVKEHLSNMLLHYGNSVMFAYGGGSIKANGIYDEIIAILNANNKHIVEFSSIMPNPTYAKVQEGVKIAKEHNVDLILAVGGGSVSDCCKIVSAQAKIDEDIWNMENIKHIYPSKFIPLGVIVTVFGTGSEMNNGAVITNEEKKIKGALWDKIHDMCPNIKFKLIPYHNSPENAREILKNLGTNIDVVAGMFDSSFLQEHQCDALLTENVPIRCAVSIYSDLADKDILSIQDLYSKNLMLIKRGWNADIDLLRNYILENHPNINIVDFESFSLNVLNQCENNNNVIISIDNLNNAHPLLKIIPVDWNYTIPFGIFHSKKPSKIVKNFLKAMDSIYKSNKD